MTTVNACQRKSCGIQARHRSHISLRQSSRVVTGQAPAHGQHSAIHAVKAERESEAGHISSCSSGGSSDSSCRITSSSTMSSSSSSSSSSSRFDSAGQLGRRALLSSFCLSLCTATQATYAASVPSVAPAPGGSLAATLNKALPFPLFPVSPPEPIGFPRKQLDTRFAVLLMRSSYDAVDALDFIPRQQFEAKFWKLRQSELEGYNYLYSPIKMRAGDLSDPLYFDFISFSQYATISREMGRPARVFEEYYELCGPAVGDDEPCESGQKVVMRPPQYADDAQLPTYFFQKTGDLMYDGLLNGFRGEEFGGPPPAPAGASIQQLAAGVQQLLSIMVDKGYALKAEVKGVTSSGSSSRGGGSFSVSIQGSCNLWGVNALAARQSLVVNVHDAMVIDAYLRASGRQAGYELRLTEAGLEEDWVVA
ncbi:hypothetical protein COO60DRAFT_12124 [Scenedesmus sp. NREL 46B-D3]|nr:hypothetical protein COO60DRAFT_12124 [Scenedesmus sp. NREL 46B-D3]